MMVVNFLHSARHTCKVINAMHRFFQNVLSIQRSWRKFLKWRRDTLDLTRALWIEIENQPEAKRWCQTEITEDVVLLEPAEAVVRDKIIEDDLQGCHAKVVALNTQYAADLKQYLVEMKKNKIIDEALRELGQESNLVAQMQLPTKPYHRQPSKESVRQLMLKAAQQTQQPSSSTSPETSPATCTPSAPPAHQACDSNIFL